MTIDLAPFVERMRPKGLLSVIVERDGEREQFFSEPDIRRNLYSASKSYTSVAVGIAVGEGLLSLDEKLTEAFRDRLPAKPDENLQKATVRDLLTMCLGQKEACLMGVDRGSIPTEDWARYALSRPFDCAPGEKFVYNNAGPYLAGLLVQERAGVDLIGYLTPRFFKPLGIRRTVWEVDPLGNTFGAGGLFLSHGEFHKLGQLWLSEGRWEGQQVLDPAWVRESSRKQVENGLDGYGYLIWRGRGDSYMAQGKYCQICAVYPEKNAVISVMAVCRDEMEMHRALYKELVPQL